MLNRIRRLNISLAAKCQLLFGSSVVLIIAAALFVPWQRMDQLTEQMNTVAATAVADSVVRQHVAVERPILLPQATTEPAASSSPQPAPHFAAERIGPTVSATTLQPASVMTSAPGGKSLSQSVVETDVSSSSAPAASVPTTQRSIRINGNQAPPPRLIAINAPADASMTAWEKAVLSELRRHPQTEVISKKYIRRDGTYAFRYAQPLTMQQECIRCHVATFPISIGASPSLENSATVNASPAVPRLLGFVSIDIPSQIRVNQLLLNRVFLLTAGMLAGTLAIVVFYLITTRLILQPVRVLQETAEMVSKGDLSIRSHINTGDEFQQLSETFNDMLANLSTSAEQLRSINKSLDMKVGQLAESNVALYESNRLKSEFLANVSHELRTPLNSILGFAELLKDVTAADTKTSRYVQNIMQSGKNLLDLINDLLDLAKIEAGRMEVRSEPLSLNDLFEGLVSILKPVTEPKLLTMKCIVTEAVPILNTDPPKLQQVLYNFLANAIKFSPTRGIIELRAYLTPDHQVHISVTDQGPGIEADKQSLIFEKFRQIDGSVTREHSGTGLGLAISKELTLLLEGEIGVQSTPGHGATFWIKLPQAIQPSIKDVREKLAMA